MARKTSHELHAHHLALAEHHETKALLASNDRLSKLAAIVRAFDRWMKATNHGQERLIDSTAKESLASLYAAELALAREAKS